MADEKLQVQKIYVQDIRQTAGLSDLSIFDESQAEELRNYIDQIKKLEIQLVE